MTLPMLHYKFRLTLMSFLLLVISPFCYAGSFIAVSDLHFNPYYSCSPNATPCPLIIKLRAADATQWESLLQQYDTKKLATYGNDTNYALLQSTLAALKTTSKQTSPQFVTILGDFLGHDYQKNYSLYTNDPTQLGYEQFVKKTMQFLTAEINKTFPNVSIYPVVGNNDSYEDDYTVSPNGVFFRELAQIWQPLLRNPKNEKYFGQTFSVAGYYAITPPNIHGVRIVVLDSTLFSPKAASNDAAQAAKQQLAWLATQLQTATTQHQKVWLLMHIPVGINVYRTAKNPSQSVEEFWLPAYANEFLQLLDQYATVVTAILSGHTHMDGFTLLQKNHQLPDSFVPAISPLFANDPAFKVYRYDSKTLQLQDFTTYYLALDNPKNIWQIEYNFNHTYQPDCKNCNLINGMKKITKNGALATAYQNYYAAGRSAQPITNSKWLPYYWCGIWHVTKADYMECLKAV